MKENKDLMDLYRLLFEEEEFQIIQTLGQGVSLDRALDRLMQKEEEQDA